LRLKWRRNSTHISSTWSGGWPSGYGGEHSPLKQLQELHN
jgi:hypothetical protein